LRLEGEICESGHYVFPPRDICPDCNGEAKKKYEFSGKGVVESFTVMQEAPTGFEEQTPYVIAWVRLEEGPLITAQLTDLDTYKGMRIAKMDQQSGWPVELIEVETTNFEVKIGMPVEMVTRKLSENGEKGLINYSYKFRPVLPTEASMSSR
jgi:uncharacterized OB-fold protein